MPTNEPNSSSTTFPPSTHPTIPTVTPVYYPPPWCGMYGQCGCPQVTTPPACPYLAYGTGARRVRSIAQRACSLNGQCPAGSSCCTHACYRSKVCTPTITTPTPRPRKVKVSVMMTSASSDCSVFIKEHLIPFTAALQNHLQIELIPYGKVGKDGGCQYGYGDCLGNWLVSCGGRHLTGGESAQLAFAACLTQHTHILSTSNFTAIMAAAVQCTVDQPARVERMYQCAVSVEGLNLFQEAGRRQRQLTPALTQVPTIALDGVVVIRLAHDVKAFPKLLCDRLRQVAGAHQLCLATQSKLLLSTPSHR
nr:uncharacterized protein LOC123757959 [Procambarus clarkii]